MSTRIGNPQQVNFPATVLGSAAGATIPIQNSGWALLVSVLAIYTATGTTGNRQIVIDFEDAADNVIWRAKAPSLVLPGQTVTLAMASRVQGDSVELRTLQQITASGLGVLDELDAIRSDVDVNPLPMLLTVALPEGFSIPVNAVIEISDANTVDVADTVSATIIFTL